MKPENLEVQRRDMAPVPWCENATALTGKQWKYLKIPRKEFEALQPSRLSDLQAFAPSLLD
jgi:type III restriction enzyme